MGLSVEMQLIKPLNEKDVSLFFNLNLLRVEGIVDDDDEMETIAQVFRQANIFRTGGSSWVLGRLYYVDLKVLRSKAGPRGFLS